MAPSRFAFHALVGIRRVVRNDQFVIVGLSIIVGCLSAFGAIAFREAIDIVQWLAFGYADVDLASHVAGMPWWQVVAVPTLGGLVKDTALDTTETQFSDDGERPIAVAMLTFSVLYTVKEHEPQTLT